MLVIREGSLSALQLLYLSTSVVSLEHSHLDYFCLQRSSACQDFLIKFTLQTNDSLFLDISGVFFQFSRFLVFSLGYGWAGTHVKIMILLLTYGTVQTPRPSVLFFFLSLKTFKMKGLQK